MLIFGGFRRVELLGLHWDDIDFMKKRVKAKLAGKAATEIVFNKCDTGANSDLHGVYNIVERFIDNDCMSSFNS